VEGLWYASVLLALPFCRGIFGFLWPPASAPVSLLVLPWLVTQLCSCHLHHASVLWSCPCCWPSSSSPTSIHGGLLLVLPWPRCFTWTFFNFFFCPLRSSLLCLHHQSMTRMRMTKNTSNFVINRCVPCYCYLFWPCRRWPSLVFAHFCTCFLCLII